MGNGIIPRNVPRGDAAQESRGGKHTASCSANIGLVITRNQAGNGHLKDKRHQEQGDEENKENAQDEGQNVVRKPIVDAFRLGRGVSAIDLRVSIVASKQRRPLGGRIPIRHFLGSRERNGSSDVDRRGRTTSHDVM